MRFGRRGRRRLLKTRRGGADTSSGEEIVEPGRRKNVDDRPLVMDGQPNWMKEIVKMLVLRNILMWHHEPR